MCIRDRTRTAPSAVHQGRGVKCATGTSSKIRGRDITIGTWNTRTLRAAGKLQELTHEMDKYRWIILGLCKMRWRNRKDARFSSVEKRTKQAHHHPPEGIPFNITIVQAYAPTLDYDDNKIEEFYHQLHNVIDQTPKKDILVVQGDWNA